MAHRLSRRSTESKQFKGPANQNSILLFTLLILFFGTTRGDNVGPQFSRLVWEANYAPTQTTFEPAPNPPAINPAMKDTGDIYEIDLLLGQYVQLSLEKNADLQVLVTAYGPDGQKLLDVFGRRYGDVHISLVAEVSGHYRLAVRSLEKDNFGKRYDWRVDAVRNATAQDRKRAAGLKLFAEADRLQGEWNKNDLRRAIEQYTQAVTIWGATSQIHEATAALQSIGEIYFVLSEYPTALDYFRRALVKSRVEGDRGGEIEALNNLGYVRVYQGQNLRALPYFRKALAECKAWRLSKDRRGEAQALNNMGEVYYSLGDLRRSLSLFNSALELWITASDRKGQALSHLNIGYAYYDMGDTQAASDHYQQSVLLWRAMDERRGEALSETALGGVYSFVGERQLALDSHNQALEILRTIGDRQGEAAALNGIGRIYEESNKAEDALDNYTGALKVYQEIGNRDYEALTECYVGRVYRSMQNVPKALDSYRRSISVSRGVADRRIEAYALKDIATIYSSQGQKQAALDQYARVLGLYRKFGDRRGQAQTLNNIGLVYQSMGQGNKALGYYRQALPINRAGTDLASEAATRYNIARTAREGNLLAESLSQIRNSISIIETLRAHIASYELRSSYFALIHEYYGFYIDLLMQLDKQNPSAQFGAMAFEASESARARSLSEILLEAKTDIREGISADLLARERDLQQKLSARAKFRLRLMNDKRTEDQAVELEKEIRKVTTEYQAVETTIREQSPGYAELSQPRVIRVVDVQRELLDDQTVLLEYALGSERSYLWMVTPTSLESFELPQQSKIEDTARRVYKLLTARQPLAGDTVQIYQNRVADSDKLYWKEASSLSEMLLRPVAKQILNKRLLIVTEGSLQYIPFEALPTPEGVIRTGEESLRPAIVDLAGEPMPLVLNHEIVSLPSASTLSSLRFRKPRVETPDKIVEVFADPVFEGDDPRIQTKPRPTAAISESSPDPNQLQQVLRDSGDWNSVAGIPRLPATLREGKAIMAVVPNGDGRLASGFDANRSVAMSPDLEKYQIVHFATHGVINSEHPELSGIILSMVNKNGMPEDGFLQLHDIYNLKLSAQLVVLSACSTGLGKDVKGEGLIGLTRGFMYAGSQSTIASLWKVDDDATAELMENFYQALLQDGKTPAAALKTAKETMWRQRRWHQPFYWGAFVLQGEYQGHVKVRANRINSSLWIVVLVGIGYLMVGGFYLIRLMKKNARR